MPLTNPPILTVSMHRATSPLTSARAVRQPRPAMRTGLRSCPLVQLHASRDLFVDHVERHFANEAALDALRVAVPCLADRSEFASPRALIRALRSAAGNESSEALLAGYAEAAKRSIADAIGLGWVVEPSPQVTIAFASTGLLAVIQSGVLRTMFFPGLVDGGFQQEESSAEARRARSWTDEERLYFRVFRPAVQVIRSLPDDAIAGRVSQYGALKRVLPRSSALRLENWLSLRARSPRSEVSYDREGETNADT